MMMMMMMMVMIILGALPAASVVAFSVSTG